MCFNIDVTPCFPFAPVTCLDQALALFLLLERQQPSLFIFKQEQVVDKISLTAINLT